MVVITRKPAEAMHNSPRYPAHLNDVSKQDQMSQIMHASKNIFEKNKSQRCPGPFAAPFSCREFKKKEGYRLPACS
jgi:hypothetical protein